MTGGDTAGVAGARGQSEPQVPPLLGDSKVSPLPHQLREQAGIIWLVPRGKMCSRGASLAQGSCACALGVCAVCPGSVPAEGWGWDSRVDGAGQGGFFQDKAHPQKSNISLSFCLK